jgi:hypothetical protein
MMQSTPASESAEFTPAFVDAVHDGLDKVLDTTGTTSVLFQKVEEALPDAFGFHEKPLAILGRQGTQSREGGIVKDLATRPRWSLDVMKVEGVFGFEDTMAKIEKSVRA